MPRYSFACDRCELEWTVFYRMTEISRVCTSCPQCKQPARRLFDIGMIRVRDGTAPTRIGTDYQRTKPSRDPGFQREFESILGEGGMEHPSTHERYKTFDDEGGKGPYTALPSDREAYSEGADLARDNPNFPSGEQQQANREAFHESQLDHAKKRKKGTEKPHD